MFDANDIQAVMNGTASRGAVFAVLTSQTCGENCWHAREEICRCSCGGANHGCLTHAGASRPDRTSKLDGHLYRLKAVGYYADIRLTACDGNKAAGYRHVEKPIFYGGDGEFIQYKYTWSETDCGAPYRVKFPTDSQRKWAELTGWKDGERFEYGKRIALLWERVQMPEPPTEKIIERV